MPRRFCLVLLPLLLLSCREPAGRVVQDGLGRSVVLPKRIHHAVALAPNITEMFFALGEGEKLVGIDDHSNFPPDTTQNIPRVGGMQPNLEKIVALKPDVVFASSEGNQPGLGPALAAAGIPLFVVRTDRISEIAPAMRQLGGLVDALLTDEIVETLERDIAAQARKREQRRRVMFAVWVDPLYVGGRETFTDDLLNLTGATNAVDVKGWPQYSLESLLASPPDIILYPKGAVTPQQIAALQKRVPELRAEIIPVDEDIFQRPGPRVADAARALNAILDRR